MFRYLEYETDAKAYAAKKLNEKGWGRWARLWWNLIFPTIPVVCYCTIVVLSTKAYRLFADMLTEWGTKNLKCDN